MGLPRIIYVVVVLLLNTSVLCNGGMTSSFVRKVEKTIDMPFLSDVFSVPPGYNAPQQVFLFIFLHLFILFLLNCDFLFVYVLAFLKSLNLYSALCF